MVDLTAADTQSAPQGDEYHSSRRRLARKVFEAVGWLAVLTLIIVGLGSLYSRVGFMVEAFSQDVANPVASFNAFDIRYVQHYLMVWSHLILGFFIFVFGPLQFVPWIRKNYIGFHRWTGRVWIVFGAITAFTGAFIGVVWPFTGHQGFGLLQAVINSIIGPYTLFCLYSAYSCIRARKIGAHREWIIRSFALMLGVATQRVLMLVFIPMTGLGMEVMFSTCMVIGMIINILAAEMWIHLTRTPGTGNRHWRELDKSRA